MVAYVHMTHNILHTFANILKVIIISNIFGFTFSFSKCKTFSLSFSSQAMKILVLFTFSFLSLVMFLNIVTKYLMHTMQYYPI